LIWPGARLTYAAPPRPPSGHTVAGAVLVPVRGDCRPLVEEPAHPRTAQAAKAADDRLGTVHDGLAAAGRTGGALLQVIVGGATARRVAALRRAATDPCHARHRRVRTHAARLAAGILAAAAHAVLD
jgi:hypothetical protein